MTLEKTIQNNLIQVFKRLGYDYLGSHIKLQGNSPKLDDNFRVQMNRLNKEVLQNRKLSDTEFERLRNAYPKNHSEAFQILRNGVSIVLDNNRRVSIKFIDKLNVSNNVFQITDELIVTGFKTNRLDLVILVNGVPISNIEMKRPGGSKGVEEAIGQINRYTNNGIYHQDLLNFMQLFAATDGVETRYFSVDPRVDRGASYGEFAFTWMDEDNRFVNKLETFVNDFYNRDNLVQILFSYMLMKALPVEQIIVMRPYQIHAVHKIISTLNRGMNTYISASTGSGKTLTSFKTAETLAAEGRKVIMLLDRNDLAEQTTREFKTFDTTGLIKDLVKGTDLHNALNDDEERLVITTIQSFNKWLVDKRRFKDAVSLADSGNVVILVDECHRSTSGEMFANLKRTFMDKKRNILKCRLVGFTGTPLLEANAPKLNLMTQITFGESAHIYTITEAIRDKSVLGFKLFNLNVQPLGIDEEELSQMSNAAYYGNHSRISANAYEIVKQFKNHSLQLDNVKDNFTEGFSAMLAADSKQSAVLYWEIIRELFGKENRKTAIIFSLEQNRMWGDSGITEEEKYREIIEAYDKDFGTSLVEVFDIDVSLGREKHLSDLVERSKHGEIDMVVVSDMLLTGYDNKYINTIYLDKSLKTHGLLQAASRTNRVFGSKKPFGNVVLFSDRNMEEAFKESIMLFGTAENIEEIIDFTSFRQMEKKLRDYVSDLKDLVFVPEDVGEIATVEDLKKVVQSYRNVSGVISGIRVYPEWNEDLGYSRAGTSKDELYYYSSNIELAKRRLMPVDPDDPKRDLDIDFAVSTIDGEIVGYKYILKLLNNFVASPPSERDRWLRHCEEVLRNATDPEILQNRDAIERVLDAARNDEINTVDEMFERLEVEKNRQRSMIYEKFADDMKIPYILVEEMVDYRKHEGRVMPKLRLIKFFKGFRDEFLSRDKEVEQEALLDDTTLRDFAGVVYEKFDELFIEEK